MNSQWKSPKWYSGHSTKLLQHAQDLLKDRDLWVKHVETGDENQPVSSGKKLRTKSGIYEISKEDLCFQLDRLRVQTGKDLDNANTSYAALKNKRERGVHKFNANIQGFLSDFATFINSYSGIVEIVKAADSQFGGLAWGTLSVFLSVAVVKQEREDEINRAILEFSRHCPRLKILNDIYPDEDLQRHIAEMYTNIIHFARSATVFYQRTSIKRIVSSSNPRENVTQIIEDIQTGLVNIRLDCEALMQHRVYDLSKQIEELKGELTKVNMSLERSRLDRNDKIIAKLRERFHCPEMHTGDLSSYRSLLSNAVCLQQSQDNDSSANSKNSKFSKEPILQHWLKNVDAGVLFISGKNAPCVNQTTLNWLSQAAIWLVEQLKEEKKEVAYFFCQTKPLVAQKNKPTIKSIFVDVTLQLLKERPLDHRLESNLESIINQAGEDEYGSLQTGIRLTIEALKTFPRDETVFLILDRIDQCQWKYETERSRLGVSYFLSSLLNLVFDAPCKLKVFVVSTSTSHRKDLKQSIALRPILKSMGQYFERLDWDQE